MKRFFSVIALAATPVITAAQGTLSGAGFGYPAAQLGARGAGTGGALGAFDPISPINPAALAGWQYGVIFFHLEPEYRSTKAAGLSSSTRLSRFPLAGIATRISDKVAFGVTFSTYLDRTWATSSVVREEVGADSVDMTLTSSSGGAINDIRAGLAYTIHRNFQVGAAYHAYTGQNRLRIGWDFPDSTPFGDVLEVAKLGYSGKGVSLGAQWTLPRKATFAAYTRRGGRVRLRTGDTLIAEADMPNHLGVAVRYDGMREATIAAGWERIEWSSLNGLSSTSLHGRDADKFSAGIEARGPSLANTPVTLRFGFSKRNLPFDVLASEVKETTFALGSGFTLARGQANLDIALQRASRSAGSARERAWFFTLGLAITPGFITP